MRRSALLAFAVALLVGCGGTQTGGGNGAGDALAYLPADAATVLLLSTDVDGEQWRRFDELVFQRLEEDDPTTVAEAATQGAEELELSWKSDVKPLLGNELAIAITGDPMTFLGGEGDASIVGALETRSGEIERVLEKAGFERSAEVAGGALYGLEDGGWAVAVEGDVLVFGEDEQVVREALNRRDSGGGLDEDAVQEQLGDLPEDNLLRGFGTLARITENEPLSRFANDGFVQALESWAGALRFSESDLTAELAVRLDEEVLEEDDLPLATGPEAPEIVVRDREISGGNRNQSQTTAFLLRALQVAYPDSRFVRAVDALDEDLGISFEEEILRQFDGPSVSYVSPDGRTFAARSEVHDPEALRRMLPRIAPHLPALVEGLQGLQSEGMALLFLFAPDAPAASPMHNVRVEPPASDDGLYRISGLTGDGPSELHLGLIGDVFVVASSERAARDIVDAPTQEAEGAQGAGVLRADLAALDQEAGLLPIPIRGKELVASLEASTDELRARVRVELD
ncbi:MAG TPA: hypothetical protein VH968_02600 [Gaiellaceae bacterium]|jgi:hypothetical protein